MRGETKILPSFSPVCMNFNPLSPCGERLTDPDALPSDIEFQSTLPMRGETFTPDDLDDTTKAISIHSTHAGRDP